MTKIKLVLSLNPSSGEEKQTCSLIMIQMTTSMMRLMFINQATFIYKIAVSKSSIRIKN
jgi:hypothetical protein